MDDGDIEIWKDIPGYEKNYQTSTFGRIKSLKLNKELILKQSISKTGYFVITLLKNNKLKSFKVHQLIAITFLDHKLNGMKLVIDHIDDNKLNNNLNNLRITTQRDNSYKNQNNKYTSNYKGVSYYKTYNKWLSRIRVNGKINHLGYFTNEIDAHKAYQDKLSLI